MQNNNEKPQNNDIPEDDVNQNQENTSSEEEFTSYDGNTEEPEEDVEGDGIESINQDDAKSGRKRLALSIGAALVTVALIGVAAQPSFITNLFSSGDNPGGVVARVNGEEITRSELDAQMQRQESLYASQGVDTSDPQFKESFEQQVLLSMVRQELLTQKARSSGVSVEDSEVEEEYQNLVSQSGSEQEFENALSQNDITKQELRANIRSNLLLEAYIEKEVPDEEISVSEREVKEFHSRLGGSSTSSEPLTDELRAQIEERLKQQKRSEKIQEISQELEKEADIEILI